MNSPEEFIAATAAIFAAYPPEVVEKAIAEIPTRTDRPTLRTMRRTCDELNAPHVRAAYRARAQASARRLALLEPPRLPRTAEEQAAVDVQVEAVRLALGITAHEVLPRDPQPQLRRWDGRHFARIAADLAARAARNAQGAADAGTE